MNHVIVFNFSEELINSYSIWGVTESKIFVFYTIIQYEKYSDGEKLACLLRILENSCKPTIVVS